MGKRRAFTSSCLITDNTEIAGDPCFNGGEIKAGGFLWSFVLAFVWSVCEIMAYVPRGRKKWEGEKIYCFSPWFETVLHVLLLPYPAPPQRHSAASDCNTKGQAGEADVSGATRFSVLATVAVQRYSGAASVMQCQRSLWTILHFHFLTTPVLPLSYVFMSYTEGHPSPSTALSEDHLPTWLSSSTPPSFLP